MSRLSKLFIGGGIVMAILAILVFPIVWFSMFESKPDTPISMEFTITLGEDLIIFAAKSDEVQKLDSSDFQVINEVYSAINVNTSARVMSANTDFLKQYIFDEISTVNAIPQSINSRPFTSYAYEKLQKFIFATNSVKMTVEWALWHYEIVSRGKNTVMISPEKFHVLTSCLNFSNVARPPPRRCPRLQISNLLPKFIVLHLKSADAEVKPELMVHNPDNPYMDVGLTLLYEETKKPMYWWVMEEICPTEENARYLKRLPYSSCANNDRKTGKVDSRILYNIYVFSDRYSNTLDFLDNTGIVGLYTAIIVYVGYKLAFDIFRSFKFKLSYTETPYPDRILQLCYEIYMVRTFKEYEMEEDLYAMLIFLFRSPETLIRFTKLPITNS